MKKSFILVFTILATLCCGISNAQDSQYGERISADGAINTDELMRKMQDNSELNAKVEGKIAKVCQVKGCWMMMELPGGESMRVTFKDYAFFVPKDIAGKTAIIEGKAVIETTSVEELRHYAEDSGASEEEIDKINEPKTELAFEAAGVIIK